MSDINKLSLELDNIIKNETFKNNLNILNCVRDENDNYEINLIINNHNIKILCDLKNYCYVESDSLNIDNLNQMILYSKEYKSIDTILSIINNYTIFKIKNNVNYNDIYNFYTHLEEKTKIKINYDKLKLNNKKNQSKINTLLMKIPRDMLLNYNQIFQIITTEIKKINSNFKYLHSIEPINNNIYELKANLVLKKNETTQIIEIKINLNDKLYPYYPPEIQIIQPKIKLSLQFAILNLNILKLSNWNLSFSLEWILINLANKLEPIIENYIENDIKYSTMELIIFKLSCIVKENMDDKINIDIDIPNIKSNNNNNNTKEIWKAGTGYSSSYINYNWNINNYIKEKEIQQIEIINILNNINEILNEDNINCIYGSFLLKYILNLTNGLNLLEIENEYLIFNEIIKILSKIIFLDKTNKIIDNIFMKEFTNNFKVINDEIILLFHNNSELQNNELYQGIYSLYQTFSDKIKESNDVIEESSELIKESNDLINELIDPSKINYCKIMNQLQFNFCENITNHKFYSHKDDKIESSSLKRIISEISSLKNSLPTNYDSTIWIRISKKHMNIFTFLISGPKDTPYENGLFLFNAYLPTNYPNIEPKVLLITTGEGSVRFNPNLYNCGKVCLSLLGTWFGHDNEKWNSKTSTFLQVLISIQSLIFIENPYFNEPGYESIIIPSGNLNSKLYNNKIQIQTIKWAIINQIKNPPIGYEEVVLNHFKIKKEDILNKVNIWLENTDSGLKSKLEEEINILKIELDKL